MLPRGFRASLNSAERPRYPRSRNHAPLTRKGYIGLLAGIIVGVPVVGGGIGVLAGVALEGSRGNGEAATETGYQFQVSGLVHRPDGTALVFSSLGYLECMASTQAPAYVSVTGEMNVSGSNGMQQGGEFVNIPVSTDDIHCEEATDRIMAGLTEDSDLARSLAMVALTSSAPEFTEKQTLQINIDMNSASGTLPAYHLGEIIPG